MLMKKIFYFLALLICVPANAQLALSPNGFNTITVQKPAKTNEKFIELARSWAANYNRSIDFPYEIYNVTENSFAIDAHRPNAFYYRNRGETYYHRIKYAMKIIINDDSYTINFDVKEIYTSNVLTEMTVASFFAADGRVKQDYLDAPSSLQKSANAVVKSFTDYMSIY